MLPCLIGSEGSDVAMFYIHMAMPIIALGLLSLGYAIRHFLKWKYDYGYPVLSDVTTPFFTLINIMYVGLTSDVPYS